MHIPTEPLNEQESSSTTVNDEKGKLLLQQKEDENQQQQYPKDPVASAAQGTEGKGKKEEVTPLQPTLPTHQSTPFSLGEKTKEKDDSWFAEEEAAKSSKDIFWISTSNGTKKTGKHHFAVKSLAVSTFAFFLQIFRT